MGKKAQTFHCPRCGLDDSFHHGDLALCLGRLKGKIEWIKRAVQAQIADANFAHKDSEDVGVLREEIKRQIEFVQYLNKQLS